MKITAVLIVEEIEKSLTFWVARMGFQKTVDVPEGDRLGFVILVRGPPFTFIDQRLCSYKLPSLVVR